MSWGPSARALSGPSHGARRAERVTRTVATVLAGLRPLVRRTLWEMTPRDHRESAHSLRRRRWVTGSVIVVGAVVLAVSLRIEPGNDWFYPATFGLAVIWTVGAFASGPLHLGRTLQGEQPGPRPLLMPLVYGALLAALFVLGALVVREIPWLDDEVRRVLNHADEGSGAPISRKYARRVVTARQRLDTGHRSFAHNAYLRAALGIGKPDAVFLPAEPMPLQTQHRHSAKSGQKHQADGSKSCRVLNLPRRLRASPVQGDEVRHRLALQLRFV